MAWLNEPVKTNRTARTRCTEASWCDTWRTDLPDRESNAGWNRGARPRTTHDVWVPQASSSHARDRVRAKDTDPRPVWHLGGFCRRSGSADGKQARHGANDVVEARLPLPHESGHSALDVGPLLGLQLLRGDHEHRQVRGSVVAPQVPQHFESVESRHQQV